jgi:hypothetical protein
MEVNVQLHGPTALPSGKSPPNPLDRRLGEPQSRSGHGGFWCLYIREEIHFNMVFPYTCKSHKRCLPLRHPDQNVSCVSRFPHACYRSCSSQSSWSNHKVLMMKLFPFSCNFHSLREKNSPERPVLKHPHSPLQRVKYHTSRNFRKVITAENFNNIIF